MRFGIIGAGWAAAEHCTTLARVDGVAITAVADPDTARAAELAGRYASASYATATEMLRAEQLDAVIVASPPGAHCEAAVAACEAGLAVFLEKPISRSLEDANAIVAAVGAARAVCAVGYQWRAVHALAPLADALREEHVRHLVSEGVGVTQARRWFLDDALSGRLIAERASHHIDLQRMVGGEVVAVQAAGSSVGLRELDPRFDLGAAVESGVVLTLHFASGALGAVHVLWVPEGYPSRHRLSVFGTVSTYELELDPAFSLRRDGGAPLLPAPEDAHPFAAGLERFIAAVRRNEPGAVVCTPLEAARSLAVVAACEAALASGDTVPVAAVVGSES